MNRFSLNRVILTTVEEDFKAIGLLPMTESDDPTQPRDVPSPDPSTLAGLDDSEGDVAAHQPGAKQPKPKMGPPADDSDAMDPDEDGGSVGAQKSRGGKELVVKGSKEASLKGESAAYAAQSNKIMKAKGKNAGKKASIAKGLPVVKKIGGMAEGRRFSKASALIEDVQALIKSAQINEEIDELIRGFKLVAENSALLADRLTEVSDRYEVEEMIEMMEGLSIDAVEAVDIIENEVEVCGMDDDEDSIRHSADVQEGADKKARMKDEPDAEEPYDVPSPAFKEQTEQVLHAMVTRMMTVLESYDGILDEMGMSHMDMEDEGAPEHEVHLHTNAKRVHVHHGEEDDDQDQDDSGHDDHDDDQDDDDSHMAAGHDDSDDSDEEEEPGEDDDHGAADDSDQDDDSDDHESDHDSNSLVARMKALKARREAMGGGRSFPHGGK